MAKEGQNVTVADYNSAGNAVSAMCSRWGVGQPSPINVSSGTQITAGSVNNLLGAIRSAKSKSGWGGGVSANVATASLIKYVLGDITSQANACKNHCPCNCNHCGCNCDHRTGCCSGCDGSGGH